MKHAFLTFVVLTPLVSVGFAFAGDAKNGSVEAAQSFDSIYWSDGDSGKLGDLKFRLANVDAPETGSMKQRGGAKCEHERELGYDAKAFLVGITKNKTVEIVRDYGKDRYGRLVVDLSVDGADPAQTAVKAGHLASWPHRKGRKLSPKPDWCSR